MHAKRLCPHSRIGAFGAAMLVAAAAAAAPAGSVAVFERRAEALHVSLDPSGCVRTEIRIGVVCRPDPRGFGDSGFVSLRLEERDVCSAVVLREATGTSSLGPQELEWGDADENVRVRTIVGIADPRGYSLTQLEVDVVWRPLRGTEQRSHLAYANGSAELAEHRNHESSSHRLARVTGSVREGARPFTASRPWLSGRLLTVAARSEPAELP